MTALYCKAALATVLAAICAGPGLAGDDPAGQVAQALVPVYRQIGAAYDPVAAENQIRDMIDALGDRPDLQARLPAAIEQGAHLVISAEYMATRAMVYDLLRDMVWTLADHSVGDADAAPLVVAWSQADPIRLPFQPGTGLAESDISAYARLRALGGKDTDPAPLIAYWQEQADHPINRILPSHLSAWVDGLEAVWGDLTDAERAIAVAIADEETEDLPTAGVVRKVTHSDDFIMWLAAIDLPLTDAERKASPDLLHYANAGAFAGPLLKPLTEIAALGSGSVGGNPLAGATNQLMRLNNWSAMTGEMHSWESYRYMTQGY